MQIKKVIKKKIFRRTRQHPFSKEEREKGQEVRKANILANAKPCEEQISIKKAFLQVFFDPRMGGAEGLAEWASSHPANRKLFYSWITKLLPRIVDLDSDEGSSLQSLLAKYQGLNADDLEQKARDLAAEVGRSCRSKIRTGQAEAP